MQRQQEKQNRIATGTTFTFFVQYMDKLSNGLYFDEFEVEGYKNMNMILEQYKKIGHSLKLRCLEITLDTERVQKLRFKYNK